MKYLIPLLLLVTSFAQADDSEFCKVKAYLAKDIVSSIQDGLEPSKINFAFPNVRSPEEEQEANEFVTDLMHEVRKLMQEESDPQKIHDIIKDTCVNPYEKTT